MKYRSRTELVSQILEAANGEATKTKIMYRAFLTYEQLMEYLHLLVERELLEYLEGSKKYKTTEKGRHFLKLYNQINQLAPTMNMNGK